MKPFDKSKKAMSEEQFRWIFILIAGAVILGFFTSIVLKQKEAHEDGIAAAELQNMESIMANAKVVTGSSQEVELFQKIDFDCDSIRIGKLSKQTREPVFSPQILKGRNLVTWALDWNMPYRATNLLFLTTDDVRYVFVYNGGKYNPASGAKDASYVKFFDELYNKIPDKIAKEKTGVVTSLSNKNNYKIRFIFVGTEISASMAIPFWLTSMKDEDVSALRIDDVSGQIGFYKKENDKFISDTDPDSIPSFYIGKPEVYAAIFSGNKKDYECAMGKAFRKLNLVSQVYNKKIDEVKSKVPPSADCQVIYDNAKNRISSPGATWLPISVASIATLKNEDNAKKLGSSIENLKTYNEELLRASCPSIY